MPGFELKRWGLLHPAMYTGVPIALCLAPLADLAQRLTIGVVPGRLFGFLLINLNR